MLHPQIVVHEPDTRLADQLRPLAAAERWALREPRQAEPLWRVLAAAGPTVFVIKLGSSPERELALIQRVSWHLPDVATVAVGDVDAWSESTLTLLRKPSDPDSVLRRVMRAERFSWRRHARIIADVYVELAR